MHNECDKRDGFWGPMLLWCQPIGLEWSACLDAGGGVWGHQVCWVRISKQEDEAGVSQVMVECSHMLFPRLQCKQSLHYKTVSPTLSLYQGICINLHFSLTSGPLAQLQHARYGCISKITSTGMTGMPRITRMTSPSHPSKEGLIASHSSHSSNSITQICC